MNTERINICGVRVSAVNLTIACDIFDGWIRDRKKTYVCVAPVSTIVDCQSDDEYKRIVNKADMVTPDGMPVVWVGRLKGSTTIDRTYGPDLMHAFCDYSQAKGYKHYFYGGSESTCSLLKSVLNNKFHNLNIIGSFAPPLRPVHAKESSEIIDKINSSNPDIIWVGLGSPKQDYWMYEHRDLFKAPILVGVGAAFDFIAGTKKQAPKWMQRSGLEWLYRLCCEPKRLWRRYLIGNTKFLYYLMTDLFRKKT